MLATSNDWNNNVTYLPGIRGVLLFFLAYVILQNAVYVVLLAVTIFGMGDAQGYWHLFKSGDVPLDGGSPVFWIAAFELFGLSSFVVAWMLLLRAIIRRRATVLSNYFAIVAATVVFAAVDAVLGYVFLGVEPGRSGAGVIISLGVLQMLWTSPRTKTVFVN